MKRILLMMILAGTTLAVGGCAVYPEQDPYYDPPIVRVAPPPPRVEPRPFPGVMPHPPERPEPPRIEREGRRPMEANPERLPERRADPPRVEHDERTRDMRRDERRWRDRDGDGRPDFREGQRP